LRPISETHQAAAELNMTPDDHNFPNSLDTDRAFPQCESVYVRNDPS